MSWSKWASFDEVEKQGILAGEVDGNKVYVGRTMDRDGNFVPAKVIPSLKSSLYVNEDDEEEAADQGEFLDHAADYHWVKSEDANITDAVTISGYLVGRGTYNGNLVVGRVDPEKRQLVGLYDGKSITLPSYDVLIYKSKGVVYEKIQKASNISSSLSARQISSEHYSRQTNANGGFEEVRIEHNQNFSSLMAKIRQLELERAAYLRDKQSFEERLDFEQRKVSDLSQQVKRLKIENSRFLKERTTFEEKFSSEHQKFSDLELRIKDFAINNSYLLKKVTSLEEAIRYEKLLVESIAEKLQRSESFGKTLVTKVTNFEETIKTQQQRIFELEGEIMVTTSSSESLLRKVTDFEETIKHLRLQIETYVKKLEISSADNDFLVQKLAMLTQTLRNYQHQLECLGNKLQSAKIVIATSHADLSRANSQIAKYQQALSSCYTVNGELMTRVSGLAVVAQNQVGGECGLNLVSHNSLTGFTQSHKSIGYGKTSSFLEVTGSDTYFVNEGPVYEQIQPFVTTPASAPVNGFTPFDANNQV